MTNWEQLINQDKHKLDFRKVSAFELPKNIFDDLKKSCVQAKEIGEKYNNNLAGHIKEEYSIRQISKQFNDYMIDCLHHGPIKEVWTGIDVITNDKPIVLHSLWVNYAKKYEFNPPHSHGGFVSFVIFVNIPYDLKEEESYFPNPNNTIENNYSSKFSFLNINYNGRIVNDVINVDKSFEGKMFMFDAKQSHQVFPFYTSDDYRITVSGNFKFAT